MLRGHAREQLARRAPAAFPAPRPHRLLPHGVGRGSDADWAGVGVTAGRLDLLVLSRTSGGPVSRLSHAHHDVPALRQRRGSGEGPSASRAPHRPRRQFYDGQLGGGNPDPTRRGHGHGGQDLRPRRSRPRLLRRRRDLDGRFPRLVQHGPGAQGALSYSSCATMAGRFPPRARSRRRRPRWRKKPWPTA